MSYEKRGVSANKVDVHQAISKLGKGLFPNAFCKILPDIAANDPLFCNILHADTAGTKTALAYLYWKETGDMNIWKGIVQDAIVMNLDDMACAGFINNFILSSTIGRNKNLINGEVLKSLIDGTSAFIEKMKSVDIDITLAGGETADVGDIVRTADVGFTAFARTLRSKILNIDIKPGDVIVGFESCGKAIYENEYNSGIGSNGLTFARHEVLDQSYGLRYPESFDPGIDPQYVYNGHYKLTDTFQGYQIGQLLLSPTRTFIPLIKKILLLHFNDINGIIHNTGGGQTKVLHFIKNLRIIKDNLLPIPPVFQLIQSIRHTPDNELYKIFNMGQRLEIYTNVNTANHLIEMAASFNIHAQITGHVEAFKGSQISLMTPNAQILSYS